MNPLAPDTWINPPPPGTEAEEFLEKGPSAPKISEKDDASHKSKRIDELDPFLKSLGYVEYEKHIPNDRSKRRRSRSKSHNRRRSRSKSKDRSKSKKQKKRRSRSKSRGHHRRSRSSSRHRRHRHRSHSRSHSRSRHRKNRDKRHKRSPSSECRSSRSSSRSHSHKSRRSKHSRRSRSFSPHYSSGDIAIKTEDDANVIDMEEEDEEDAEPPKENVFKNDGSFLEMFKKMQEEQQKTQQEATTSEIKNPLPVFGKRRGGRVLKTGMVQKSRNPEDSEFENAQDAWSVYMKEVKKYKEACCDDDSKTRPLVK